ncbi:enoyl-CoA hydratase-related protein [Mycobacterium sp. 21AC1]|uniref:enoyl-CoA hydratase-related protein n=1 Tax=[Mycobacterium] appelbergii TaxID=2939269 RepID=UPI0029390950|nr:enoyl-CoA hydratase-related protein [Mycobacterium sp. 21AC1]MDV3127297.1 enoyl-CoA hydratase-related protein [Mycobacterium sp. 21AC1]
MNVPVHTDISDGVFTLSLDAPHTGNALDTTMVGAIADALEHASIHPAVHCVLIRSTGAHFCTGGNVKDMARGADLMAGTVVEVQERLRTGLHRITRALRALEVPAVAAVNGSAVGAGFDLALMCDIRIAAQSARFAESFLRLGLVSGIGGAWFLARIVGVAKAMELTLTSEFISADTARELQIVSRIVPDDELDAQCSAVARAIAANPPQALRMAKRLVRESAESGLTASLEIAASMQAILLCGDEHRTTVQQFLENRK